MRSHNSSWATRKTVLIEEKRISYHSVVICIDFFYTVNPLYTDTRYNDKVRYNGYFDWHETLSQEAIDILKLGKNVVFNTLRNTFLIFVRIASEAILTNIQNVFYEEIWHSCKSFCS